MKLFEGILIGGVVLFIIDKIGVASIASTLNYRIGNVRFQSGNPVIDIIAQNPQNAGFVINSIVGDVYLNDTAIGNISLFQQIYIAPLGETNIPVTFRLSLFGALENLRAFIDGTFGSGVKLGVKGNINVGNTLMPLNIDLVNA